MKRIKHFISFLILIVVALWSFKSLLPSEASGADAPKTEFSTARAMEQLKIIAKEPHYVGSPGHARVREYIMDELRKMGLEPEVQSGFVNSGWYGYSNIVKAQNIIAKYPGTQPGKSVLIMSHYDSAPHSKSHGASDAGSGVVTVMESLRAYLASGEKPKNDIVVLFTDSEELGLDGAGLFVLEHPLAKEVGVALNFEARGSSGPSNMIVETNGGNANLIKEFKKANPEYPVATSLMYSIYKMLPNDTDSTVLREEGDIDGFFFAFIDDHFNYHTINDTWQNLNPKTLEHQGSYLMPLLKHFAQADLTQVKSKEDYVYFDIALFKFVAYPFSWIWPMVIIGILAFVALLVVGFRNKRLNGKAVGKGFFAFVISLLGVLCISQLFGWLWPAMYPQYGDMLPVFIYNGHWYTLFFVVLAIAFCFGVYSYFSKPDQAPSALVAPLFFWIVINILIAIKLQGAAFFVIPLLFALVAFWVLLRQQKPSMLLMVLLCVPAVLLFTPLLQFFPVGLGPAFYFASMVLMVLLFGLLLPVFVFYRAKKFLGYIGIFIAIILVGIAHSKSDYTSERQKPNSLVYYQNADTNKAYWVTYDEHLDPWVAGYLGENPDNASDHVSSAFGSKYNAPYSFAKETSVIDLALSSISKRRDTVVDGMRQVQLVITPKRTINRLRLFADELAPFSHLSYNGKAMTPDSTETSYKRRPSRGLMSYYISSGDSLVFDYAVPNGTLPEITLEEYSFDLLENPKFTIPTRPEYTMPKPFVPNDAIIIERTITEALFAKKETDTIKTTALE